MHKQRESHESLKQCEKVNEISLNQPFTHYMVHFINLNETSFKNTKSL